jgi:hypothetical protein
MGIAGTRFNHARKHDSPLPGVQRPASRPPAMV